jgi:anti-anti-sigma factor
VSRADKLAQIKSALPNPRNGLAERTVPATVTTAPGRLLIDTHGLDFMACCAFTALAEEADRCRRRGIRMCLVSRKPIVGRIITAGALGSPLRLYPDVKTALSAAPAGT